MNLATVEDDIHPNFTTACWGGGGALVSSNSILLNCRTNDDRHSSAGVRWAERWHKAGSFGRLAFVCRFCMPCKCA